MRKNTRLIISTILLLTICIFCISKICLYLHETKTSKDLYNNIANNVTKETLKNTNNNIEVDFEKLNAINDDIFAWIYIPGTNIDYPIVQGKDNDYYLTHLSDKKYSKTGSIYLDYRNNKDFSNYHSILYGHTLKSNLMFSELKKYKNKNFFDEYSNYYVITENKKYKVSIFSVYIASTKEDAWQLNYGSNEEFLDWARGTKDKSLFQNNIVPEANDKVITLSTCSYEFKNARLVVSGILKEV